MASKAAPPAPPAKAPAATASKAAPPAPPAKAPAARGTVRPREVEAMSEETATQEKRKILRSYDLAPAQFFNPNGCSFVQRAALQDVWSIVCQGNEVAAYFSELASDSPKRNKFIYLDWQSRSWPSIKIWGCTL